MSKVFVVLLMLFCHIVDDYYLQGVLASMKQKKWWEKNSPEEIYKYDYIAALLMHSMSWSFMTMLPLAIYSHFEVGVLFALVFMINVIFHFVIGNAKANLKKINLIQDQLCHMVQIVVTALIFLV